MSDVERWSEWTPSVESIQRLDDGPLAPGSKIRIRQPKFPPAVWKITGIESGRSFALTTGGLGVLVTARHWVEIADKGSRATKRDD